MGAVQVMKTPYADCIHWEACRLWVPPEASLALGFYHPNIVRTYKFACPAEVGKHLHPGFHCSQ